MANHVSFLGGCGISSSLYNLAASSWCGPKSNHIPYVHSGASIDVGAHYKVRDTLFFFPHDVAFILDIERTFWGIQ